MSKNPFMNIRAQIITHRLLIIDLALITTAVLMLTSDAIVWFFHVIFVLLAVGAFFWKFRAFALRSFFWVTLTTLEIIRAVQTGRTQSEELLEIPLLTLILLSVFFIASGRAQTQAQLEGKHQSLIRALEERDNLQEALMQRAFYDELTKLPNRALLYDRMRGTLARAARHKESVTIFYLDLDGFKMVNDKYGHEMGDLLLVAFAERLKGAMRAEDTAARLGGDEFVVVFESGTTLGDVIGIAERLLAELSKPYPINSHRVVISASVGIAQSTPGHDQVEELLRNADHALYQAKAKGKATFEVFTSQSNSTLLYT